jgi:hypothetical protein
MPALCELSADELLHTKIHWQTVQKDLRRDLLDVSHSPTRIARLQQLYDRVDRRLFHIYNEFQRRAESRNTFTTHK